MWFWDSPSLVSYDKKAFIFQQNLRQHPANPSCSFQRTEETISPLLPDKCFEIYPWLSPPDLWLSPPGPLLGSLDPRLSLLGPDQVHLVPG